MMSLVIILLALDLCLGGVAIAATPTPQQAGTAQLRAQYATKLQGFLNSVDSSVKANVSAERVGSTTIKIVRPGVFRNQFKSLISPFMNELNTLGFKSLVLCTSSRSCAEYFIPIGTDAVF